MTFRYIILSVLFVCIIAAPSKAQQITLESLPEIAQWPEALSQRDVARLALAIVPGEIIEVTQDLQLGRQIYYDIKIQQEDGGILEVELEGHHKDSPIRDVEIIKLPDHGGLPTPAITKEEADRIAHDYVAEHNDSLYRQPRRENIALVIVRDDELAWEVEYKAGFDDFALEIDAFTGEITSAKAQ